MEYEWNKKKKNTLLFKVGVDRVDRYFFSYMRRKRLTDVFCLLLTV